VLVQMSEETLLAELQAASAAAQTVGGREPLGLRAVEPSPGRRWYLCAFDGPEFLCLTEVLTPEAAQARVREVAAAGLLTEHAEELIDAEELRGLARAASGLIARDGESEGLADALGAIAHEALGLAAWREAPARAVASIAELDVAVAAHERLRAAYGRFVDATEPLVAAQERLPAERVAALRAVEEAAGGAGVGAGLAQRLAGAVPECDDGAGQVVAAHVTRLA
jgi:hypothetical protein